MTTMWLHVLLLGITLAKWTTGSEILDLSNRNLQSIDLSSISNLTNVRTVDLSNNHIDSASFFQFSRALNLETLLLANNKISDFPSGYLTSEKVKLIDLSNNEIHSFMKFDLPPNVEVILKGNVLTKIEFYNPFHLKEYFDPIPDPWKQKYPFDIFSKSNLTSHLNEQKTNFPNDSGALICKNWMSITAVKPESIATDYTCKRLDRYRISSTLSLDSLKILRFRRGWYQMSNYFTGLNLQSNKIYCITPHLLNDLPEAITHVDLSHNRISGIKKNVISNNYVKTLILNDLGLTTIEDGAFENTKLSAISLTGNSLQNLDFAKTLPETIKELRVDSNQLSVINEGSLVKLKALEHLWLSGNSLTSLRPDTFSGLNKLKYINLASNSLEAIQPSTFNLENLIVLNLIGNRIKELSPAMFNNLQMIEVIDLRQNQIEKIATNTFSGVRSLTIQSIDLSDNKIDTIEKESFANMKIKSLDLRGNKLTKQSIGKDAFKSCIVSTLNLADNSIETINPDGFSGIQVLNWISFRSNNIKILKKDTFENMRVTNQIDLRGNGIQRIENGGLFSYFDSEQKIMLIDGEVGRIGGCAFCEPWDTYIEDPGRTNDKLSFV